MPENSQHENSKRIAKNTAVLYIRMLFTMLISLYTSRVILDVLGEVDYGINNVVGGVTTMFVFINATMSVSTSRFVSFAIGKGDEKECEVVYNQARIIHYVLAVIIAVLIETVGVWFVYNKLTIPPERLGAAMFVLHSVAVITILDIIATPDMALIISYERMSSFAYISIMDSVLKLVAVWLLVLFGGDKLIIYAVMMAIIQLIDRLCYLFYCRKHFKETHSKFRYDAPVFKKMLSFAGWNFFGNLANMTLQQGITIVINIFCGPAVNAARGVASQMFNQISALANNVRMAINPQITKSYADSNITYMHKLIAFSSLSCYYLLLLMGFPAFWLANDILNIWLVKVPQWTELFFQLTIVYAVLNSFANPVIIGIHATGDIKKFQTVEAVLMLMTLPCAYVFLKYGLPPYFAYIAMIIFAVISQLGRLYTILPKIRMTWNEYYISVIKPAGVVFALSAVPCGAISLLPLPHNWIYSISQAVVSFLCVVISVYNFGLDKENRTKVIGYIRNKFSIIKR